MLKKLDETKSDMEGLIANAGIGQGDEVEEREEDPDSPAEKLSVTEMLKKRMREEEMAKEKPKRRRRSSVFGEHKESRPFVCECASYELLPDAPQSVDQLFSISNTIPPCQGRLCCACCQLEA